MKRLFLSPLIVLFLLSPGLLHADMGSIALRKGVSIHEPKQEAIIVWNGTHQLLYLRTTLAATQETKVLEVMPLPSQPFVKPTEDEVFERCREFLPKAPVKEAPKPLSAGPFGFGSAEAASVVEQKRIGEHDLRVVQLHDATRFREWVVRHFSTNEEPVEIPKVLLETIESYAQEGYQWFLFDLVELNRHRLRKTPLRIHFATDHLYYPMRITRTEKGKTKVSLNIIAHRLFKPEECLGIPLSEIKIDFDPVALNAGQLHYIDPPVRRMFGESTKAYLQAWEIEGEIDQFDHDLLVGKSAE